MAKQPKSYWQAMSLDSPHSRDACRSWFGVMADEMMPYKAEVLCDIKTDKEKKLRAFMRDGDGREFKLERTLGGRNFTIRRVAL